MNLQLLAIQVFNGLVNGAFYALLSLGLAVIFGMLRIVNFAHGALYMLGAFGAFALSELLGLGFWPSLILAPLIVGLIGVVLERLLLRRLYGLDHSYNLLLTFGLTLLIQDLVKQVMLSRFAVSSAPYTTPDLLTGVVDLGFVIFPKYRLFVIAVALVVCLITWYVIERTRVGAVVRAAAENPIITRSFGINVSTWVTIVFGVGVGLAGLAGVLAAPIYSVDPYMGAELIITTFAVVVIGGMGSILGSVVTGFAVGVLTAVGAALYPPISNTLVFVLMALVLLFRPSGLFGLPEGAR